VSLFDSHHKSFPPGVIAGRATTTSCWLLCLSVAVSRRPGLASRLVMLGRVIWTEGTGRCRVGIVTAELANSEYRRNHSAEALPRVSFGSTLARRREASAQIRRALLKVC